MNGILNITRGWQFVILSAVLLVTFAWFLVCFFLCVTGRSACDECVWFRAESQAGLIFVLLAALRVLRASKFRDNSFNWIAWFTLCAFSPVWLPLVFDLVLRLYGSLFGKG